MIDLLMEMMCDLYRLGFCEGVDGTSPPWTASDGWRGTGMARAKQLIRRHAKALGFDSKQIPTEPGLYWIEPAPQFPSAEALMTPQMVELFSENCKPLRMRLIHPKLDLGTNRPPDDPCVVRYLGRVSEEPIPMTPCPNS